MKQVTKTYKDGTVEVQSLIKRNFSRDFMKKIFDVYSNKEMSIVEKTINYDRIFREEFGERRDYRRIGEGTNRFVCLLDNHIIKVAYNYLAYIDNVNELAMSKKLPKHGPLALAYETNGLILVSEYVAVIDKEDFLESQLQVKKILGSLEQDIVSNVNKNKNSHYILGDMGMSSKNYGNWGRRPSGELVILDYGYLYKTSFREWKKISKCPYCGNVLEYTDDYTELQCSSCKKTVKYTTLRNNLGYKNIINTIKNIVNEDEFGKYDSKGKIDVDVYKTETYEIEEEKPEIPNEILQLIDNAVNKFFDVIYKINNKELDIDETIEDIKNNRDMYYPELYPMLLLSPELNDTNMKAYINDMNSKVEDIKNLLLQEVEQNNYKKLSKEDYDKYNEMMVDDEIGYDKNTNKSNVDFIDKLSESQDDIKVVSSLDDVLNMEFGNVFMADENEETLDKLDGDYNLDELMMLVSNEKEDNDVVEEEESIDDKLKNHFENIKIGLIETIDNIMDTDDFVEGEYLYSPLLNGDLIDYDYSPEVNAQNILGGWKPEEFCFPLYRHLIITSGYDTDEAKDEFEARYKIDDKVTFPQDMYDNDENVDIVIDQILTRFEEKVRPSRFALSIKIKKELINYYKALDEYYENNIEKDSEVTINDPSYYYNLVLNNTDIVREMRAAEERMEREIEMFSGLSLKEALGDNKIIYDYDYHSLMSDSQQIIETCFANIDVLNRHSNVDLIINDIKNEYYDLTRSFITNDMIDIFKYGPSYVEDTKRKIKPEIRCYIEDSDSNVDVYKPVVFNKENYFLLKVENRFEKVFKKSDNAYIDIKHKLKAMGLKYSVSNISGYVFKRNRDNFRYLITEHEYKLINEYEEMYGMSYVNDIDKLYANTIVELLDEKHNMCEDTYNLFKDIANYGLNKALARRQLVINILDMKGITRLDYLNNIE